MGPFVVTVSDGTCSSTDTVKVISAFEPTANFTWSGGCVGSTVSFTEKLKYFKDVLSTNLQPDTLNNDKKNKTKEIT